MLAQPGSHGKDRAQEKGQILKVSLGQGPELEQLHPHQILEGKLEGEEGKMLEPSKQSATLTEATHDGKGTY